MHGHCTATVNFGCTPHVKFNLRPITTTKGKLLEWQLLIGDPPQIDYQCLVDPNKPIEGNPIITQHVIRFHPNDVTVK